jgi:prephenate dehydrogenase
LIESVGILGLGLMGGSLGLALKRGGTPVTVHGFTRSCERGELALSRGAIDCFHDDPREAVKQADVVVCCAPILAIPDQVASILDALKPGAVVTDVGSTKTVIQASCRELMAGREACFIGSHPIAGSEQQGMEAAKADLYNGAMTVITPDDDAPEEAKARVRELWERCGSCVVSMSPEEHDKVLAATSHLPHMMSSLLAATIARPGGRDNLACFCGTGYRGTTRLATGGTDIWLDILKTNRDAITVELKAYEEKLRSLIEKLEAGSFSAIEAVLEEGKSARRAFDDYGNQSNSEA